MKFVSAHVFRRKWITDGEMVISFEGRGKETKTNASLFHMTLSYAAIFLSDTDLKKLFS